MTTGLDRIVHEPARLRILMLLSAVEETDSRQRLLNHLTDWFVLLKTSRIERTTR